MDTIIVSSPNFINMSFSNIIAFIGFAGIVVIVTFLVRIGRKLQILDDLKTTSEKIKTNLKVVCDFLIRSSMKLDPSQLQSYSPIELTNEGKKFITDIGFDKVFEKYKTDFFSCIESEKPKLKYDVEMAAVRSISILYDKEYMSFLKILFYNDPQKRNMGNTAPTLGIYVRDKYLAEHPEISE